VGRAIERTFLVSGIVCYLAWQVGTLIGVLGVGLAGVENVAGAIFPVLFIGLASLAVTRRSHVVRALAAALLTAGIAFAVPDLRGLAPVIAAVLVALPGGER
jgi:predicted branched-subunit amino acid permease